ncbi:MAG: peptide deformylase [Duodenibacillus sp.]|nr:peptide deformylase [Duodenibacillus sp.]
MALLPIVQYPSPVLASPAEPVTVFDDKLRRLAADMAETMYKAPGVGLAAPQVGALVRMVVIDVTEDHTGLVTLVNPEVEPVGDECLEGEEGCLSLPGIYEKVKRFKRVRVKAQDLDGNPVSLECEDLMSVCVQHETDHLKGCVFVDRLSRLKKTRAVARLAKRRKEKAREGED